MEAEYTAAYARLYREHWWWRVREQILLRKIRQILTGRADDVRILDVGCGAGLFFDVLENLGHVEGVESDRLAVDQSGGWRDRIHLGQLDTFAPGHAFDLILMLDVLEHVERPEVMLREAASLLAPGGRVLITVPAFDWLWTSHDEMNHHIRRYTTPDLRRVIEKAGLAVVEASYLFQSLTFPKLLVRAKEACTAPSAALPRVPPGPINRALQAWFRFEHASARWLPFGSSALAVARRPHA